MTRETLKLDTLQYTILARLQNLKHQIKDIVIANFSKKDNKEEK